MQVGDLVRHRRYKWICGTIVKEKLGVAISDKSGLKDIFDGFEVHLLGRIIPPDTTTGQPLVRFFDKESAWVNLTGKMA
ncbi:MAG TPA: hypothetical protein EYN66_06270 [Myxococcales bacterium]|nr:hypothetical protein [Myxococcales bacterium]